MSDLVERLRAVLEFYADPGSFTKDVPDFYSELDFGAQAQDAIAILTELEGVSEGRRVQLDKCSTERAAEWRRAENAEGERDTATRALADAIECVEAWSAYAGEYFQEKHDLAGDLARLRAALSKTEKKGDN